jgi:poly-beta-hydroxybutyrate-responsive repressor
MPEVRGDQLASSLPRNYMRSCVLLLLREEPAHGYDLLQRLRPLGFARDDPGRLYRALRWLEEEKLVRSTWEASETGPDRRRYELTRAGVEQLHEEAKALDALRDTLAGFAARYEEFVAMRPTRRGAPAGSR